MSLLPRTTLHSDSEQERLHIVPFLKAPSGYSIVLDFVVKVTLRPDSAVVFL
jgi:hypothetical protein